MNSKTKVIAKILSMILIPLCLFLPIMYISSNFIITVGFSVLIIIIFSLYFMKPVEKESSVYKPRIKSSSLDRFTKKMIFSIVSAFQLFLLYFVNIFNIIQLLSIFVIHIFIVSLLLYIREGYIKIKESSILLEKRSLFDDKTYEIEYESINNIDLKEDKYLLNLKQELVRLKIQ